MEFVKEGNVIIQRITSRLLQGNPLRDPVERDLYIYLPPDHEPNKPIPALLAVVGFTGTGGMLFNQDPLGENLNTRLDRLINTGVCPPVRVVAPDCFTRLGGNQYINSPAIGRYEDYLLEEIIPFVNSQYPVSAWGVFGKSSGGYGSIVLGMRHPEVFRVLADHSGDSNFELCYIPDFSEAYDSFRKAGGPSQWLEAFWRDPNRHRKQYHKPLNVIAMAAHYSPNPKSPHLGIDFPFDLETGVLIPEIWERWRGWDPVNMVASHAANIRKLDFIYIDCGFKDEFTLHWGARALVASLKKIGVTPYYEEFDDGHMSISYRYDVSLPMLAKALVRSTADSQT